MTFKLVGKLISLVLALALVLTCAAAFAESYGVTNTHTITVTSNGTGAHSYEAYQVFAGNLDAAENKLTDIKWGSGVDGDALISTLKANTAYDSKFAAVTTAADVAKVLGENTAASFVEAFAADVAKNLTTTKAGTGTSTGGATNKATISVTGDGYYFVKDVTKTEELADGDTYSKFMLNVIKDVAVTAKDTVFAPDKKILKDAGKETETKVAADSSAIGDTVTFVVDITIPDTSAYIDHFIMNMFDKMPAGLTLMGISSVTANGTAVPSENYTMTVKNAEGNYAAYTAPATAAAAVTTAGGQEMKIVFNNFKKYVEDNSLIGKTLTVKYTAVVNDDAVYGPTGNENEVSYKYSTDPNHDYDGDEPTGNDPVGETPKSKTKTVVTALQINKVNGSNAALAGAEFTITGTAYNTTLVTGEAFEEDANGAYWKLLDGSYTTTDPATVDNKTQYASDTTKYKKVAVEKVVTVPTDTKIVGITNDAGVLNISGLKPGTYTIEETHAPDGYNKITETKKLVITWDAMNGFGIGSDSTADSFTMKDNGVCYEITIVNNAGTTLPSTGGIGTTLFYIIGGLLVVGAAVVLVARRKAD